MRWGVVRLPIERRRCVVVCDGEASSKAGRYPCALVIWPLYDHHKAGLLCSEAVLGLMDVEGVGVIVQ